MESTTLGNIVETFNYNTFGEITLQDVKNSATTDAIFNVSIVRDSYGRVSEKTETVNGVINKFTYEYDIAGRLIKVEGTDQLLSEYVFDSNGNITSVVGVEETISGVHDNQDRLITHGDLAFTYTKNGDVLTQTVVSENKKTTFTYDSLSNLKRVVMPSCMLQ